jgi:hypothetical protein
MSLENPNRIESSVSKNTTQRRTFLKRATAGAVIASIPGRSAWAGIAGSIVASGHGSDFNQGACTHLLNYNEFARSYYTNDKFIDIFGGNPFNMSAMVRPITKTNGKVPNYRIRGILEWESATDSSGAPIDASGRKGINDINIGLIVMYLNAVNHGYYGIEYPVLNQHGGSASAFAAYLYREALADPATIGTLLNGKINDFSSGFC